MDSSLPGSCAHGNSPGKNTGVGCHSLFQGIFPTQGSNLCLLHCRQNLLLIFFGYILRSGIARLYCISVFNFCEISLLFSTPVAWFYSPNSTQVFQLLASSPTLYEHFILCFNSNCPNGCVVIFHCGFEHIFICLLAMCISSLEKCLFF